MDTIIVSSVVPSSGSAAGGTVVLVYGVSFVSTSNTKCIFGDVYAEARVLNSSVIECVSPLGAPGSVQVGITIDGYSVISDGIEFTYVDAASVSKISPVSGSVEGSTNVTVYGAGFTFGSDMKCYFGSEVSYATYVSATELVCV
jgi:hypothetical protein